MIESICNATVYPKEHYGKNLTKSVLKRNKSNEAKKNLLYRLKLSNLSFFLRLNIVFFSALDTSPKIN